MFCNLEVCAILELENICICISLVLIHEYQNLAKFKKTWWVDGWMDGWMDAWIDGRCINGRRTDGMRLFSIVVIFGDIYHFHGRSYGNSFLVVRPVHGNSCGQLDR